MVSPNTITINEIANVKLGSALKCGIIALHLVHVPGSVYTGGHDKKIIFLLLRERLRHHHLRHLHHTMDRQ